jgi:hypothetical protein
MNPAGLGPENDWQESSAIVNDRFVLSSERMLHKDYDRKCSVEKKITEGGFQGACRQDEMMGCKLPVVK